MADKKKKQSWSKYKNPLGGLTKKAVSLYRKQNPGSKLKMGVTGKANTPERKMRRGRFLVRFYGRKDLPPLKDKKGRPTRFALAINRWVDKPPKNKKEAYRKAVKTVSQARKLAAKGRKLIAQAKREMKRNKKK